MMHAWLQASGRHRENGCNVLNGQVLSARSRRRYRPFRCAVDGRTIDPGATGRAGPIMQC